MVTSRKLRRPYDKMPLEYHLERFTLKNAWINKVRYIKNGGRESTLVERKPKLKFIIYIGQKCKGSVFCRLKYYKPRI